MKTSPIANLLIIVHPGSACGSADMNLGRDNAGEQRGFLQVAIENWKGPVAVIDGELSDELEGGRSAHCELGRTINEALDRARAEGVPAIRLMGDDDSDFNQELAAAQIASDLGLTPDCAISVTGAWYHSSDGGGCVGSVKDVLEEKGFTVTLLDPVDLDWNTDLDLDMDDEPEDLPPPAKTRRRPG